MTANATKIANSVVMQRVRNLTDILFVHLYDQQQYATTAESVYIHGSVYDIENGQVSDIGVPAGPPRKVLPPSPFPELA